MACMSGHLVFFCPSGQSSADQACRACGSWSAIVVLPSTPLRAVLWGAWLEHTYATASRYRASHARQARMYNRLQAGARVFLMDVSRDSHNLCSLLDRVPLPENLQKLIPGEHIDTVLGKKEVLSLATRCRSAFSSVTLLLIFSLTLFPHCL